MKKKQKFMLFSFLVSALLFMAFFCSEDMATKKRSTDFKEASYEMDAEASGKDCILAESHDLGWDYMDKLIFLGESTTYGLWRYGMLSGGVNTTQVWTGAVYRNGKATCAGTLSLSPSIAQTMIYYPESRAPMTVAQAVAAADPQYLVITLGLNNGASYYTEDQFKRCYRMLLDSIKGASGEVTVILQSIFPIAKTCNISAYTPRRIALCNAWIRDLACEYGLKYLDTASVLADENGYLFPEYDNGGDGIHLNEKGLSAVVSYIKTHGHPKEFEE